MPTIAESCEKIIRVRKDKRLPIIREKLKKLRELKDALKQLQEYQNRIKENRGQDIAALRERAQRVYDTIYNIDLNELLGENGKIEKLEKELERLEKRFGRDGVQIALVGTARKGKSTFLQSLTGLPDEVIPASSGSDCTGAVSVIENVDDGEFRIQIDYYNEKDFIDFFSSTFKTLVSNEEVERLVNYTIRNVDDVRQLKEVLKETIKEEERQDKDVQKLKDFYEEYYSHGLDYLDLITGRTDTFYNQSKVSELVAKYRYIKEGDEIINADYKNYIHEHLVDGLIKIHFNKYIAVKKAYIWNQYRIPNLGKIIMMDTVGLGNENTGVKDEAAMYKVLREDTDAAIFNFRIEQGMSVPPGNECQQLVKLFDDLDDLSPELWFSVNANRYDYAEITNDNLPIYKGLVSDVFNSMNNRTYGRRRVRPFNISVVNNKDEDEVINKMIIPVLEGITNNLGDLDEIFMKNADDMAKDIYQSYKDICDNIMGSLDALQKNSPTYEITLRENYNSLLLSYELHEYCGNLCKHRDEVLPKLIKELKPQIENLTCFLPNEAEILKEFRGMNNTYVTNVYNKICDDVTVQIINKLHEVSTKTIVDIEEELKIKIAKILYEHGRLNELSVSTGKLNDDSGAIQWLRSFCNEKLYRYSHLKKAVTDVLDFHMKIEGFIFAKCIKASEILEKRPGRYADNNAPIDVKVKFVYETVSNKVLQMIDNLNQSLGLTDNGANTWGLGQNAEAPELAKPSLLLWCAADSFNKVFLFADNGNQLKDFYREYAFTIWHDKFQQQVDFDDATKKVYQLVENLKVKI